MNTFVIFPRFYPKNVVSAVLRVLPFPKKADILQKKQKGVNCRLSAYMMKHKQFTAALLALCLLLALAASVAAVDAPNIDRITVYADAEKTVPVEAQEIDGMLYLFLPSNVSPSAVPLTLTLGNSAALLSVRGSLDAVGFVNGGTLDLTALCGEGTSYTITILAKAGTLTDEKTLTVVPTQGIASMYLISENPETNGREWVESSPDKSNSAKGNMFLTDETGEVVYHNALTQIKGRGNSTWAADKKPYQIKLDKKTDLLQTGDSDNASKTWVLLTNHADPSLLRNGIVYDLSVAMGMKPGIECRPVNLFYDGEYRGAYLLCEKVEVKSGRVDITDLEEQFEDANPTVGDFDDLPVKSAVTANGATYYYCDGLTSPTDLTGGYLLEMDTAVRAAAEKCYFYTTRNQYVVVKSPEYCSKEAMQYIASYYQEFEDTLYHQGKHPSNGKSIEQYLSVESAAQCYIINELTKNPDGYRTSSYLYKDAGSDIMTMGPIWDYDLSFGISFGTFVESAAKPEGFFTLRSSFCTVLYDIGSFRQAVNEIYTKTVAPLLKNTVCAQQATADGALQSITAYADALSEAAYANTLVWRQNYAGWTAAADTLRTYISERNAWLTAELSKWNSSTKEDLTGYIDVDEDEWYYDEVMKATEYGILQGMNNGIFAPDESTTRAQAAKVLFAMSGAGRLPFHSIFPDVRNSDWFAPAVMWAYENKVVNGYEDGTFRPENSITRQEMIVLLHRYLGSPVETSDSLSSFHDASSISNYARAAMRWAAANDILKGYEDGTIRPTDTISRKEMAALTVRFYEQYVKDAEKQ